MKTRLTAAAVLVLTGALLGTFWGGALVGFAACWLLVLWTDS